MDDLAAKLLAEPVGAGPAGRMKIDFHFGDRPEVLEAIRTMARQKATAAYISRQLEKHSGIPFSEEAVRRWVKAQNLVAE